MMMYKTNPTKLIPDYLVSVIYSDAVQTRLLELAGGSTVGHIRVNDIRTLSIPHPTCVKEQQRIADVLAATSTVLENLARSQGKLNSLKRALMQDLLTGRKRVTALMEPEAEREAHMPVSDKVAKEIKLDERNHVEKPLLDQLAGLGWQVLDLDSKQHPVDTFRENFAEVVMLPVLRQQLEVINPWLEADQVEEVVKQLTASFPSTGLI